jgi:hypothetical protein
MSIASLSNSSTVEKLKPTKTEALNVSARTISEDLRDLEVPSKLKPAKTEALATAIRNLPIVGKLRSEAAR